jgi:heme exporter protein D
MNWGSLTDFLSMGGYATYVWSSFFLFFSALAIELWTLRKEERELVHILMLSKNVSQTSVHHDHLQPEEVDS